MILRLDHLAVSARTLAEGADWVAAALGVSLSPGGQHAHMATHNRLIGLGDLYLEVIAIDPDATPPKWPRWFDLDHFAGRPRLTNWVAACDDLDAALAQGPAGLGRPVDLSRGDYRWRMAVPDNGKLPFDGGFPALIHWQGTAHPAKALPDVGLRLRRFEVAHPEAASLRRVLAGLIDDARLVIVPGPKVALRAVFATPQGDKVLD